MDDNKVGVLLEQLSSQFRTFGEGLDIVQRQISSVEQKVDGLDGRMNTMEMKMTGLESKMTGLESKMTGLEMRMTGLERKVDGLIEDMDIVKPALIKIDHRLDAIEGEIIKINPESQAVLKQVK